MKFYENLKYLRKKDELTQEELAERLNVSRQTVEEWEKGEILPNIKRVKEIAHMFSVSLDSLIGDIKYINKYKNKKKMSDIKWYIFGILFLELMLGTSVYRFISQILKNQETTIVITIIMFIIMLGGFIISVKSYLKGNNREILNMENNPKAKWERIKIVIKEFAKSLISWCVISIVMKLELLPIGIEVFLAETMRMIIIGTVFDIAFALVKYVKLEKEVIELNNKN